MFYAVSIMSLGYTRINGVVAYNNNTYEFLEITPAVAKKLISNGQMKGLLWKNTEQSDQRFEFVCDKEGFNQQNILVKTACGKFRPLYNDYPGNHINSMCSVVRVFENGSERKYEVISNTCFRITMNEKYLRKLAKIAYVSGVVIGEDEIKVCDGVVIQSLDSETRLEAIPPKMIQDLTMEWDKDIESPTCEKFEEDKEESLEEQSQYGDKEGDNTDESSDNTEIMEDVTELSNDMEDDEKVNKKKTMFDIFKR